MNAFRRIDKSFLESLQEIVDAPPTPWVFLSWRPHTRDEIGRYFTKAIMTAIIPTIGNIERYLEARSGRDSTPSAIEDALRAEIMGVIPRKIRKCG